MSRTALGEFEHHVMLALVRLGGRSRGAPIVLELEAATRRTVSPAAVFVALRRLEQRGYARSSKREARPGEGGRGSREFQITAAGKTKLAESRRTFERLWARRRPGGGAVMTSARLHVFPPRCSGCCSPKPSAMRRSTSSAKAMCFASRGTAPCCGQSMVSPSGPGVRDPRQAGDCSPVARSRRHRISRP